MARIFRRLSVARLASPSSPRRIVQKILAEVLGVPIGLGAIKNRLPACSRQGRQLIRPRGRVVKLYAPEAEAIAAISNEIKEAIRE